MADPILYVEPPARRNRRGGIRTVASFVPQERLAATSTVQYTSEGCGLPQDDWTLCYDLTPSADEKTFDGVDTNVSPIPNFVAYSGVECFLNSEDDFAARARNLLALGEDRIVERKLGAYLLSQATPGTAASVVAAVAAADQFLDTSYPGLGVIVMSRAGAVYAKSADVVSGDDQGALWTVNGTPVLASGEVSDDYVFATGAISVFEGPVTNITAPLWGTNVQAAIAERAFGLAFDCGIAEAFAVDYSLAGAGGGAVDPETLARIDALETDVAALETDKADVAHTHAAADITSGSLAIARIPTGTTATTVALGSHTHTAAAVGAAPASHTHTIAQVTSLQTGLDSKVDSVTAGTGATVDNTDPANPVVSVP